MLATLSNRTANDTAEEVLINSARSREELPNLGGHTFAGYAEFVGPVLSLFLCEQETDEQIQHESLCFIVENPNPIIKWEPSWP